MKSKIVVLMCVLSMASLTFGDILVGNFENDGLDYGWYNTADSSTIVTGTGNTVGDNALAVERINGGWGGTFEVITYGTPAQAALGSVGQVTVDVTAFGGTEVPAWWGSIGLLLNCDGYWNALDWQGIDLSGTPTSMSFQLDAGAMAAAAAAGSYCNFGFIVQTADMAYDEITGDPLYESMFTAYFDNVQVVPEPATMVLLGLGALVLRRRK